MKTNIFKRNKSKKLANRYFYGMHLRGYAPNCQPMEGLVTGVDTGAIWLVIPSTGVVLLMCAVAFRNSTCTKQYVPVELRFRGACMKMTALRDSGNMLVDPVTGGPILVLDAKVSQQLTGLSKQQLGSPVEVMQHSPIPGLRLIPYKTIGQSNGLLLGIRIPSVRVGRWKGCLLVAFAPEVLARGAVYQMLTGGTI